MIAAHDVSAPVPSESVPKVGTAQLRIAPMPIDFAPTETPMGGSVLTTFFVRGIPYVVDMEGALFALDMVSDHPEEWSWHFVQNL